MQSHFSTMLLTKFRKKTEERTLLLTSRQQLTSLLCLAYFATLLITPESYKYAAILLAVAGLGLFPGTWRQLKTPPAMLISGALLLYFIVTLFFAIPSEHYSQIDMPSRVLLAIIIFALLLQYPPSLTVVLYGCSIGASAVGLIALYQHYILDIRALSTGGYMSVQVAGMAASLSVFSILAYIYSCQHTLPTLKKIAFLGITLGFTAPLLCGGRGSWVITPFVALWAVFYYRKHFQFRDYLAIATSVALIIVTAVLPALNRGEAAISEFNDYQEAKHTELITEQENKQTPTVTSSTGIRLELWKTALLLATENPITGTGYNKRLEEKQKLVEQGHADPVVTHMRRAHNQFFEELQVKGLVGFSTLIVLLAAPWLATRKPKINANAEQQLATVLLRCHLILIAGYMLTQHYINAHSGILFFSLGVVIFASMALRGEARD
ncbi:O-antigen ligase family protein [Salinivibrio sp. VYel1]|nr:O-antigen ligase family protein [Salinivibrio sp. VYel1]